MKHLFQDSLLEFLEKVKLISRITSWGQNLLLHHEADKLIKEATAIPTKASTYRSLDNALDGLEGNLKSVDLNLDFDMVDL